MNIIRKGQICWLPKKDVVGQKSFVDRIAAGGLEANCETTGEQPSV
jgi:hypothetical protein